MPKSLIKAFPRPQRKHRFFFRVLNFAFFLLLATTDVLAMNKITPIGRDIVYFFLKLYNKALRRNTDQSTS